MGEFFSAIIGFFIGRSKQSSISAYAILFLVAFMLWAINHYSIISRIDTYFATGNMIRIAEVKEMYKDNPQALVALDEMLDNELEHKTITGEYMSIFSLAPNPANGIPKLYNTLSTCSFFIFVALPFVFILSFKDFLKGDLPLIVDVLSFSSIALFILLIIWVSQYITSNIPLIWNSTTYNYILNLVIQIVISAMSIKWFYLSCKRATLKAEEQEILKKFNE